MYICVIVLLTVTLPIVQAYNRNPSGILKSSGWQAYNSEGSLSYFRWQDNYAGSKYILSTCQMEEPFQDKSKQQCTLSVKLSDKTKVSPDEDTKIDIKCGETTCSYTGKPYHCDEFSKTQKSQINFYECIIATLSKETRPCEKPNLDCSTKCKTVVFKKAEEIYNLQY